MNVSHNRLRIGAIILALTHLGACGMTDTIDSSEAPDASRALILGASSSTALFSPRPVIIQSVDGRKVAGTADSVRVAPGIHTLEVTCVQSLFARNTHEMTVSVQGGRTYVLTSQISPNKISDGSARCRAEIEESVER